VHEFGAGGGGFPTQTLPGLGGVAEEALHLGGFVREQENVILLGASGTGKARLAEAVGMATIYAGARAEYRPRSG